MSFWQVKEANSENILLQLEKLFQMSKSTQKLFLFYEGIANSKGRQLELLEPYIFSDCVFNLRVSNLLDSANFVSLPLYYSEHYFFLRKSSRI